MEMELQKVNKVEEWRDGHDKRTAAVKDVKKKIRKLENVDAVLQILASIIALIGNIVGNIGFIFNFIPEKGEESVRLVLAGAIIVAADRLIAYIAHIILIGIFVPDELRKSGIQDTLEVEKDRLEKVKEEAHKKAINLNVTHPATISICSIGDVLCKCGKLVLLIIKIFDIGFDFLRYSMKVSEATSMNTAWASFSTSTRVFGILGVSYDVFVSSSLDIFVIVTNVLFLTNRCMKTRKSVKNCISECFECFGCFECCRKINLKTRSEELEDIINQINMNKTAVENSLLKK